MSELCKILNKISTVQHSCTLSPAPRTFLNISRYSFLKADDDDFCFEVVESESVALWSTVWCTSWRNKSSTGVSVVRIYSADSTEG